MDYDNLNILLFLFLFSLILTDVLTTYYSLEKVSPNQDLIKEQNPLIRHYFTDKGYYAQSLLMRLLFLLMIPYGFRVKTPYNFTRVLVLLCLFFMFIVYGNILEIIKISVLYGLE